MPNAGETDEEMWARMVAECVARGGHEYETRCANEHVYCLHCGEPEPEDFDVDRHISDGEHAELASAIAASEAGKYGTGV